MTGISQVLWFDPVICELEAQIARNVDEGLIV